MRKQKTLWAYDAETDPFLAGRYPEAFLWCAVSEYGERIYFWGKNATEKFLNFLFEQPESLFIGHNAGKFDALFLIDGISGEILLVDGRIIKCKIGNCEMRDSMAILPMPLSKMRTGGKIDINYEKLERNVREKHKQEIIQYCFGDCETLLESVLDFYMRAGRRRLTIASQASAELRAIYPDLPKLDENHFAEFKQFFFGGRVQCFEKGVLHGNFQLLDVNQEYPAVMAMLHHPYGAGYNTKNFSYRNMPDNHCGFFIGTCDTAGAFPVRLKDKSTPYLVGTNIEVKITLHELYAAIKCGAATNFNGKLIIPEFSTTFENFIIPHTQARLKAKLNGDEGGSIYHKFIPNSSYGRFAMSPEGRDEHYFAEYQEDLRPLKKMGWKISDFDMESERFILSRPARRPWQFYEDVATGASITGGGRATLMMGIARSKRPLLCDTDSNLCEHFTGAISETQLGAWKIEATCEIAAIAGKKMYVLLSKNKPKTKDGKEPEKVGKYYVVKKASKGVNASGQDIFNAASGKIVKIINKVPTMRMNKKTFVNRKIKLT